jgi:hypothetical protein
MRPTGEAVDLWMWVGWKGSIKLHIRHLRENLVPILLLVNLGEQQDGRSEKPRTLELGTPS